jgi:GNAT superfamily N-acetyltransferase
LSAPDVVVRDGSPADAKLVHSMLAALASELGISDKQTSGTRDIEVALSGSPPDVHALIAERNGRAVGMALVFLTYSTWRGQRGVYVQDLYVAREARGIRAGQVLMNAAAAWGADHGATHLRLSVDLANGNAQSFYETVGLRPRDDERLFEIDGEDFGHLAVAP